MMWILRMIQKNFRMHLNLINLINQQQMNQPTLEVAVTDQQHTMTFNGEQVHICEEGNYFQIHKLKIITKCKTENCVYTFSIYNIYIFFTITINFTIGWWHHNKSNITSTSTPTFNLRTNDTTKTFHCILARQHQMPIPLYLTPAPVFTDAIQKCVDTAAEVIATHREARLIFMQGLVRRNTKGSIQRTYKSPL